MECNLKDKSENMIPSLSEWPIIFIIIFKPINSYITWTAAMRIFILTGAVR